MSALAEAMTTLRPKGPQPELALSAFVVTADGIVAVVWKHRTEVIARLQGILVAS